MLGEIRKRLESFLRNGFYLVANGDSSVILE